MCSQCLHKPSNEILIGVWIDGQALMAGQSYMETDLPDRCSDPAVRHELLNETDP